jgi:hypothetical protein
VDRVAFYSRRKLTVLVCGSQVHPTVMAYTIHETPYGDLVWRCADHVKPFSEADRDANGAFCVLWCQRGGLLHGLTVSAAEAEAITGLTAPVAFDRLREMVHGD